MIQASAQATRFFLVRHGQTEWNRQERFRGQADMPLNETGREQARRVAERLVGMSIAAIYSSRLQRATQTAQPLAEALHLPIQTLEGLLDIDYGTWEGLSPEEVAERDPERYRQWLTTPQTVTFPDGEGLADVRHRAMTAIHSLAEQHVGQAIVLVSHKIVNKVILCAVLGLTNEAIWRIEQETGAINVFDAQDGRFVVSRLNDTCHLG